ncbi:response regulator [Phormidesmis sp. 146-35]
MITYDLTSKVPNSLVEPTHLSPITVYYLRKLLRQNFDRLLPLSDRTVDSALLDRSQGGERSHGMVLELEQLVLQHEALSSRGAKHLPELRHAEQEIFRLLGFKVQETLPQATILVVDDTPEVLQFLSDALTQEGYEVCSAIDGGIALNRARDIQPDLVLLDIMMSGIDGYEVCERLKTDPLTSKIPVIFISAMGDSLDKVKAFGVGGVDYVTKPFQIEEVFARVEHQLKLRSLQKRLEEQNVYLQIQIQERQQIEERYRDVFDNAVNGMFQTTPDGRFLRVNRSLAQLLGYSSPTDLISAIAHVAEQLYVRPQRRSEFATYLQQYGAVNDFESQVYCKDGRMIWISEDVRTVKDAHGNLLFYEGIVKDITARKQAEEKGLRDRIKSERFFLNFLLQMEGLIEQS